MSPSLADRLRALGPDRARAILEQLERELGPEGIAALDHPRVLLRPAQSPSPPWRTIEAFAGERRVGKSHAARELFLRLLPRAERARIMVAVDDAVRDTVYGGESGLKEWAPPWVRCELVKGDGYAGAIHYGDRRIVCCSAAAPAGSVGPGWGLTWADDPAAWVKTLGKARARAAWIDMLKSNSARPAVTVVATTGMGVDFLWGLLHEAKVSESAVRIHDLGQVENNASNLASNYLRDVVPGLRADGSWEDDGDPVGAFADIDWQEHRVRAAPRLAKITVFADPNKSANRRSCEVGIVAVGLDARGNLYGLADASAVLAQDDAAIEGQKRKGWPAVVHDLAEQLAGEFPNVPIRLGVEDNATGPNGAALLRAEGKLRGALRGGVPVCRFEVFSLTARPNEPKTRRAAEIVKMAKNGQVYMLGGLGVLEGQLCNLTDHGSGNDRADAFVWGARDLAGLTDEKEGAREREVDQGQRQTRETFEGFADAQKKFPAPTWASASGTDRERGDRSA
jgi:hypothetical protein